MLESWNVQNEIALDIYMECCMDAMEGFIILDNLNWVCELIFHNPIRWDMEKVCDTFERESTTKKTFQLFPKPR